ncbi:MAG TPA: hypothetical protein VK279_08880, partial [Solirubrobacteraceae bacterium]|nr:hypothetical protein [Solirubrobacteraceae bacterium]
MAGAVVVARLSALSQELRARGIRVGVGEMLTAHRALAAVDAASRERSRLALRAVLCSRRDDLAAFDDAFLAVFGSGAPAPLRSEGLPPEAREVLPRAAAPGEGVRRSAGDEPVPAAWSR